MKSFVKKSVLLFSIATIMLLSSCTPYKKEEVLCEYEDFNCLYYLKDEYKKYKYSDYIFDDISSGAYKRSTPNITDYRNGAGILDYDISSYVQAKLDYSIKLDLIKRYEMKIDSICASVHSDYFMQRNSYVYYYDKKTKETILLEEMPVTNISYDDEMPMISFDIDVINDIEAQQKLEGRRIMLSDIIASNTTIDGYMKVILAAGKEKRKYFMNERIDNNELFTISTPSEIN